MTDSPSGGGDGPPGTEDRDGADPRSVRDRDAADSEFDPAAFDPDTDPASRYADRVADLLDRARRDRRAFEGADRDPESYLREGAGQAVWVYVEARTGGRLVWLPPAEYAALEWAMNTWLELYARAHGRDAVVDVTLREAAELLLDTRNIDDVAAVLTGVPERD